MKYLHPFLPKEILWDTTISLITIFFTEIGLSCWWNFCFSISISPNFIIAFFHVYIFHSKIYM